MQEKRLLVVLNVGRRRPVEGGFTVTPRLKLDVVACVRLPRTAGHFLGRVPDRIGVHVRLPLHPL